MKRSLLHKSFFVLRQAQHERKKVNNFKVSPDPPELVERVEMGFVQQAQRMVIKNPTRKDLQAAYLIQVKETVLTKGLKYAINIRLERLFCHIACGRNEGFFLKILLFPLYLLSLIYYIAVNIRLFSFGAGLFKARKLGCKVISVGNITVGGTGKTPTVEFMSRSLREKGFRVAILSRGYKRKGRGIEVVSDGKAVLLGPEAAGDEPYMLARRLKNIPVFVGADRYKLGRHAQENFPLDLVILDDGYQHISLKRDLDILLVDGEKGFGNGFLIPRGPLREPLSGIKRAGIVLINKASAENAEVADIVMKIDPAPLLFKSNYRAERLVSVCSREQIDLKKLSGARVMALSAIADPASFLSLISSLGGTIASEISFPDHYGYTSQDLKEVMEKARTAGAGFIVTTEKDAVKLEQLEPRMDTPIYYLEIDLDMRGDEQRFIDAVLTKIQG